MRKKLVWQAYTNDDRNKIISEVKDVISASEGYIMNFQMFSDLALSLSIEIEENGIIALHQALTTVLEVTEFDEGAIRADSKKEWLLLINISFGGGTGVLKGDIPAVPG